MKSGTRTSIVPTLKRIAHRPSNVIKFGASQIGNNVVM